MIEMSSCLDKDKEKEVGAGLINDELSRELVHRHHDLHTAYSASSSSCRHWSSSGFKNPRIVRVSRNFGGKDRHSKVCTIRGLRDRRIRLSVPTAIQLYDLQDRLGLSQPSKVIDWLIDATKLDIDKLPPLQFPPGCFAQFHPASAFMGGAGSGSLSLVAPLPQPHHFSSLLDANMTLLKNNNMSSMMISKEVININVDVDVPKDDDQGQDEDEQSMETKLQENIKWNRSHPDAANLSSSCDGGRGQYNYQLIRGGNNIRGQAQSFFPIAGTSTACVGSGFLPAPASGLIHNISTLLPYCSGNAHYNPYWDPSSLSLSQFHHQVPSSSTSSHRVDAPQYYSNTASHPISNTTICTAGTRQLSFCPSPVTVTTSFFPQHASYGTTPGSPPSLENNKMSSFNHELPSSSLTSRFHSSHNTANKTAD